LTKMNPFLEIDVMPKPGIAAMRHRTGNNHHHGKAPEVFPDVFASVLLSKSVNGEAAELRGLGGKFAVHDIESDEGDIKQDILPEEKAPQPLISVDVKQCLQNLVVIEQRQAVTNEPATLPVPKPGLLSTLIAKIDADDGETGKIHSDGFEQLPKKMPGPGVHKFHDIKPTNPPDLGDAKSEIAPIPLGQPISIEPQPESAAPKQMAAADVKVRVIKVETSFAPASTPAFVVQLAQTIADSLDGPVHNTAVIPDNPVPDPRRDVVKSIQIQLHPDDLGKIKVAMHLRGDTLKLQIEVTSKQAETLLLNDHHALKDLMGRAGYDVSDASISISLNVSDLNLPQRHATANDSSQESLVGQGSRQHPGTSEENPSQYQKMRGPHATASEFEGEQRAKSLEAGVVDVGRANGVFI
jgi:Flagellar hook-length control protein FliK